VLLIGFAGAFGAVSRYALQSSFNAMLGGPTLWGTFAVNISGAFVLGLLVGLVPGSFLREGPWLTMLTVGFLGAYTTFSTLMLEVNARSEGGAGDIAFVYLASSIVVGLVACYSGLHLGRALN
jgi:CrcB protein